MMFFFFWFFFFLKLRSTNPNTKRDTLACFVKLKLRVSDTFTLLYFEEKISPLTVPRIF